MFFFFSSRRRHTRYWRDWSSDVCSSDLTAVVRERKDQFAATLASFVQDNFLNADVVAERIRTAEPAARAAGWLRERGNAESVARHATESMAGLAELVAGEDVQRVVDEELEPLVE